VYAHECTPELHVKVEGVIGVVVVIIVACARRLAVHQA